MLVLAFAGFGLFANASNLPVKRTLEKVKPLIAMSSSQAMKSVVVEVKVNKKCGVAQWMWYYYCGGKKFTGCCYDTTAAATSAGNASIASNSACQ